MDSNLKEKEAQIVELSTENAQLKEVISIRQRRIERFQASLYQLVKEEQDVRKWPKVINQIYKDHRHIGSISKDDENRVPMEELKRQTKLMERKVVLMATNKVIAEEKCRQDIQSKTTENSLLIHELNMLRVDRKSLQR